MNILKNIIWLIFGGLMIAFAYLYLSIILMFTIIGIPFGLQTMRLALLAVWPFDREVEYEPESGCLSIGMNVLWLLIGGLKICVLHIILGVIFYITIVGIPLGKQHFKMAEIAATPFRYRIGNEDYVD